MTEFELDELIGRSAASYAGEPPPGLAGRVLARTRRPSRWWPVAVAAIAAAVLAVLWMPLDLSVPPQPLLVVSTPAVPILPAVRQLKGPAVRSTPARSTPLSPQERRLRDFVLSYPELANQVLVEGQKRMSEPLEIAPLTTQPIVIEPLEAVAFGGE